MAAAAGYAEGEADPPEELLDAFRIERWGPPVTGGWMEWPVRWMRRMEHALTAYRATVNWQQAISAYEGDDLQTWRDRNPETVRAVLWVEACLEQLDETDG